MQFAGAVLQRPHPTGYHYLMAVERREQVFVSSTYLDLVAERQEVIQTLLEADCIPAGMELFPASDDDRWTLIRRVIDDCDYYVVVVGGRYGSIDPDRGLSYTQMEFEYAKQIGLPIMGFLHGRPESIEVSKSELDSDARRKLADFRSQVETRMVKYWTTPQELAGQVAKSLIQTRKTHPAEGWVRARNALTPEVGQELAELRARVVELTAELEASRTGELADAAELEQGADLYPFSVGFRYWTSDMVKAGTTYSTKTTTIFPRHDVSWDRIFAFVGPTMIDEVSESNLDDRLDDLALDLYASREAKLPRDYGKLETTWSVDENLHDIKIQLFALGLIQQSDRRRAVSDKEAYWTLTQRGRERLMRLRARRRPIQEVGEVAVAAPSPKYDTDSEGGQKTATRVPKQAAKKRSGRAAKAT